MLEASAAIYTPYCAKGDEKVFTSCS